MNYLEAVEILQNIEDKYDVMSIKYKGVSVWPFLRIYLVDSMSKQSEQKVSASNIAVVIKSLFFYNPFEIFKKHKVWVFSGTITRKKIGSKYEHHVIGALTKVCPDILLIENPEANCPHYKKKEIIEKHIVSNSWTLLTSRILELFLRLKRVMIENEELLISIIKNLGVSFNYKAYVMRLLAQKIATDLLLKLGHKPKTAFMICPYGHMGYVWALHSHGIPVVELQHGVINEHHYAYNSKYYTDVFQPDEICVYGENEYHFFSEIQQKYAKRVTKTGLYILERSEDFFACDIFQDYRGKYRFIVVAAGQTGYEKEFADFIDNVASNLLEVLFIYIPRRPEGDLIFKSDNVLYKYGVNIYEYLKWCDVHCTISSTTCLEAHFFHKPNIFFSKNGTAKEYYGDLLGESNGTFYAENIQAFINAFHKATLGSFEYKDVFVRNSVNNIKNVISRYVH